MELVRRAGYVLYLLIKGCLGPVGEAEEVVIETAAAQAESAKLVAVLPAVNAVKEATEDSDSVRTLVA